MNHSRLSSVFLPILCAFFGLSLGLLVTLFVGENPIRIFLILANSSFGSLYDFGMTLFYATPLILTGLSVSYAFRAGLFNIGAEGQLALGALAATAFALSFPTLPSPFSVLGASAAAAAAGGAWAYLAGFLKATRGTHEVITTIMSNFIAAGIVSYFILYVLKDPDVQGPETALVAEQYLMPPFPIFEGAPVGYALLLTIILVLAVYFWLENSRNGFEVRAVGENFAASQFSGIQSRSVQSNAMFVSGAIAGLVGVLEVLANSGKLKLGFSPGYGFTGIAVALLARANPLGVVAAALLFGALHKGTIDLDFETEKVTKDISEIIQALVVLAVSAEGMWSFLFKSKKNA